MVHNLRSSVSEKLCTDPRLENDHDLGQVYELTSKTRIYKVVCMWYAYSLGFSQSAACTLDRVWN